jgi:uncharacterized protein (TIGR03437 family)
LSVYSGFNPSGRQRQPGYTELSASAEALLRFSRIVVLLWPAFFAAADTTTYIGDAYAYHPTGLAVDAKGNTYLTGSRTITAAQAPDATGTGQTDVFISKLDTAGNLTLVATVSGKGSQQANGIAVDPAGNIYIAGSTTSPDFPLHNPLQGPPTSVGSGVLASTGFVMKLRADGTVLYSTLLGGSASVLNAVAADAQGNAYVGGESSASDYQHTSGLPAGQTGGSFLSTAFFAKISPAGDQIVYAGGISATGYACLYGSSCFLSRISNAVTSIALDPAGNAYLAGNTYGAGLSTTPGALSSTGIGAFVGKVNAAGTSLGYLTLVGHAASDPPVYSLPFPAPANLVSAIAVDAAGNAYLAGWTTDPNFPVTPSALQPALAPALGLDSAGDGFVAKLNPAGSAMVWATFLGGTRSDTARNITVDPTGNVWVSGPTLSLDFPASEGVAPFGPGREFLAEISPSGSSLLYAARYPVNTVGAAIAADSAGVIHLAGGTGLISTRTPAQTPAPRLFGITNAAAGDLTGRIAPGEVISIYGLHLGPPAPVLAAFDANGLLPTTLGGMQVTINNTAAPLIYVSDQQINAIVPLGASGPTAAMRVSFNGAALPDFRAAVDSAIPEVFRISGQVVAAINQDGTFNSSSNPAKVGTVVWTWSTGFGNTGGLQDGQMATGAQDFHLCCVHDMANNTDLVPIYAGAAPGMASGLVQINFQVTNSANYYLHVNNKYSGVFSVWVSY